MKEELMKRFLDLIEKTGDKVVITDPAGERPYVLMSLDQYEKLALGSQEKPVLEKPLKEPVKVAPKKEIPLWRSQLGRELAEAPVKEFSARKGAAPTKVGALREVPAVARIEDFRLESEGEEQFYLEPLE